MKSPLKWVGGKSWILDQIEPHLGKGSRLIEPFAGSAAVWLGLPPDRFDSVWLNDTNSDLINFYAVMTLSSAFMPNAAYNLFGQNSEEDYLRIREEFNAKTSTKILQAAQFLYLNRHGFRGMCRYNSAGGFNVPYGNYKAPYFPEAELIELYDRLESREVRLTSRDFERVIDQAGEGDTVYCDPPYIPASVTSNFTAYAKASFNLHDHQRLANCCRGASARGATVVLSNSDTPESRALYPECRIEPIVARRSISAGGSQSSAKEIIVIF